MIYHALCDRVNVTGQGAYESGNLEWGGIRTLETVRGQGDVVEKERVLLAKPKTKRPPMFKVILLNDDYTPMDFVVEILSSIFHKEQAEAIRIMMEVHNRGAATCGVYSRDIAETKADQAVGYARRHQHPLQCLVEQD